jgi:peptidoglycan-associated lipoprotein
MRKFGRYFFVFIILLSLLSACSPKLIIDGNKAYDLKQYATAPDLLQKEFSKTSDPEGKRSIAMKIANSYRSFNKYDLAEKWYLKAADLGVNEALFFSAKMQQSQERFEDAIVTFKKYGKADALSRNKSLAEIKNCENALDWKKAEGNVVVKNIDKLNTKYNDFSPMLHNGLIYFSSTREDATGNVINEWIGEKNADIFSADKSILGFDNISKLDSFINTNDFEGTSSLSKDGNSLFFTRCGTVDLSTTRKVKEAQNQYCKLFFAKKISGSWIEPEQIKFLNDSTNIGQPCLSFDGKMLIFSSDATNGFGGKDLYYSLRSDTGWSSPQNLGIDINTKGDEMFPWFDEKGNLYFASNGLPGMGGLDVFKSIRTKKSWKSPENLKSPINSGADDFGYIIEKYKPTDVNDEILKSGYFSSNRKGGKGGDDIYSFQEKWVNYFVLKGNVVAKKYENPDDPDSKLLGVEPLDKVMIILKSNQDSITLLSNTVGLFSASLKYETDYKIIAYKPNYFSTNTQITTKGKRNQDSIYINIFVNLELEKIFPQKEIVIPNIYYDYNKATLREESKVILDSILVFFNENKDLSIEIGSHTDSRGSDQYNEKLSQARAQSVVDYLILKGVENSRLTAKGYGETKPVNTCINDVECTEEEHQKNRRTTFRITGSKMSIESTTPEEIKTVPKE